MASGRCEQCGREEYMPYVCKFCKGRYCAAHRLPENHACKRLDDWRHKVRAEGKMLAPEPGGPDDRVVRPTVRPARAFLSNAFRRAEGRMAWVFLGTMAGVFVLQFVLLAVDRSGALHNAVFVLDGRVLSRPWTVVTSIFAHHPANPFHLILNGLAVFFFGPMLENLLGTRRFTLLFLGAGVLGGLGEATFDLLLTGEAGGVIGASGAIMGMLGALTILAPNLTILLFFFVPAPLWIVTVLYAILDFTGAIGGGSGVAHLAHLSGLAVGLLYGRHLHNRGLRARVAPQRPAGPRW